MKTMTRHMTMTLAAALLLSLGACVKDDLRHTPHPGQGVAAVAVNPPACMDQVDFAVEIDGETIAGREGRYAVSGPLPPGDYAALAYNRPRGFTFGDGVAGVEPSGDTPGLIAPLPDPLYSGVKRMTLAADDTTRVDLDVARRNRDLHIELTVTEGDPERIAAVSGTLSGVARAYDLYREEPTGEAAAACPTFTRGGDKVSADLRLLGTGGEGQALTLVITFTDGLTRTVESDLTEALAGFGEGDMTRPFTIAGSLHVPTEATPGGCTITDWLPGGSGGGSAQ